MVDDTEIDAMLENAQNDSEVRDDAPIFILGSFVMAVTFVSMFIIERINKFFNNPRPIE